MYNTSSSGFGRGTKSKGKNNFMGRADKIDPDLYYTIYDQNTALKKKLDQLEKENKKLSAKLQYNNIPNPLKEESKGEIIKDKNTMQIEIDNLKNKNKRLNSKITALQKDLQKTRLRPGNNYNRPKSLGGGYPNMYQINDYEKLITHLQQTLKTAHEDRRQLIEDLNNLKDSGASKAIIEYSDNIRDKNLKLSEMALQLDKLKDAFETNEKILQLTKKALDEYTEKYSVERNKNRDLENQIQLQKSSLDKLDEYATLIEEYKKKEQLMEQKIMDLCENPFIKQMNERDNTYANLRETQMALSEAQRRLKIDNDKIIELESQLKDLNEKYNKTVQERDQFREDGMRYKIDKEEREKQGREFDALFNRISQFGEVDSNYEKILNLLKGQLSKDSKGNNWENIDFLEKMDEFPDNKEELIKEIQRLKIEKGVLGQELEKTKNVLALQQQLNDDIKKKQDVESKLYIKQINSLKEKLRKLAELIDRKKIPADLDLNAILYKDYASTKNIIKNKEDEDYNIDLNNKSVYTSITGFSKDSEEEFAIDENCLDLYITTAKFDIESVQNKLGLQIDDLMSFITVDFYLHETQTSNLMTGQKPNYNLQLSFKVSADESFILYLKEEFIIIELYYLKNNTQTIFASGKINLSQLIQIESDPQTRVVHGYIEMFYINDSSIKMCDIKYKMRMRKSIFDKIKWINEKNQLFKELDPINEANMRIMGELNKKSPFINMSLYDKDNINNKVYNIKIMIIKGENLQIIGPSRRILPYLYYRFYKQNEHFSNAMSGTDPLFDDIETYTCVYNGNFHEYLDRETLNIYIFDNSRPIQVDTDGKEVEMVRSNNSTDLIGICKIQLRGLILNNRIEGKFPITNEEGISTGGFLVVNIVAEEIVLDSDDKKYKEKFDAKVIEGVDPLLLRLAAVLRDKGLNMNSAFRIFDKDNEDQISLDNFKSVLYFTLQFTKKDDEILKLVDLVFKNKVVLDKQDFYQVFNNLLPFDDRFNTEPRSKILGENTEISFTVIDKINNTTGALNQMNTNNNIQNNNYTNYNNFNNNNIFNNSNTNISNNTNNINYINSGTKRRSRTMRELMLKVDDYMFYFGKRTASDLFKIFDVDENLRVGIKELADGFAKMQIALTPEELEMIWMHIVGTKIKTSFGIEEFMVFYDKYKLPNRKAK